VGILDIFKDGLDCTAVTGIAPSPAELVNTSDRPVVIVDFLDFKKAGTGEVIKSSGLRSRQAVLLKTSCDILPGQTTCQAKVIQKGTLTGICDSRSGKVR
jgi:hypothetical protein